MLFFPFELPLFLGTQLGFLLFLFLAFISLSLIRHVGLSLPETILDCRPAAGFFSEKTASAGDDPSSACTVSPAPAVLSMPDEARRSVLWHRAGRSRASRRFLAGGERRGRLPSLSLELVESPFFVVWSGVGLLESDKERGLAFILRQGGRKVSRPRPQRPHHGNQKRRSIG